MTCCLMILIWMRMRKMVPPQQTISEDELRIVWELKEHEFVENG